MAGTHAPFNVATEMLIVGIGRVFTHVRCALRDNSAMGRDGGLLWAQGARDALASRPRPSSTGVCVLCDTVSARVVKYI